MIKRRIKNFTIAVFLLNNICFLVYAQLPKWRFSILAGISDSTVKKYGGFQTTKNLVLQQFQTINAKFNQAGVFNGTFEFAVDSVYQFSGNPVNEIFIAHPNFDYRVVYDAFLTQGGGWYGPPNNSIHHSWRWDSFDGIFGSYATDGITHEFGHSRGAVDLYAIQVDAVKNLVNGQSYSEAKSIMNSPYGETIWDKHSISLINRNEGVVYADHTYITTAFPDSIGIVVFDSQSNPVPNAEIKVYPIEWYQYSVIAAPLYSVTTNSQGDYFFSSNPFIPNSSDYPWDIRYANFLVSAKISNTINYKFMSLPEVQNSYFNDISKPYRLVFGLSNTAISEQNRSIPYEFSLHQNYPNPFNPTTTIKFGLPEASNVTLKIYDALGREIAIIVNDQLTAGYYSYEWNAGKLSSGMYIYRLTASGGENRQLFNQVKKLLLTK